VRGYFKKLLMAGPRPFFEWARSVHARIPDSLTYGKPYRDALKLFLESDWWDEQTLVSYQEQLLRSLMDHCYTNTSYYRSCFTWTG
jgi:hypothetical protein